MTRIRYERLLIVIILLVIVTSCKKDKTTEPEATSVSSDFESGNIGEIVKGSNTEWELYLADDNNNPDLPDSWRNWWYVQMDNLTTDSITNITIKNRGWPFYYLPVYSYDQTEWLRFSENEVNQNSDNELIISKQFNATTVWIARFYPYTFTDLENYIETIETNPNIEIQIPGYSQNGNPIYAFRISNFNTPVTNKKRVLIHARTHPAETCPSFLLEGMINYLISGSQESSEMLSDIEFYIFPMQNVDGVITGNYRTTPLSENLEVMWYYNTDNPTALTDEAPAEVQIIHQYAENLMNDDGLPISIALNLHASNSEPDTRTFFYPHFGSLVQGYTSEQASLWDQQISFINTFASHFGGDMIEPTTAEGGSSFASKTYPESWWWVNYQNQVMAITMEMTYGRAGYSPNWITPDNLRDEGAALALSIRDYFNPSFIPTTIKNSDNTYLKYPELYPPADPNEMKK